MDINGNLKTPCNIYGICGYKQSGKNTVAKIWQLLDYYYNTVYKGEDFNNRPKIDIDFVLHYLNNNEIQYININSKEDVNKISTWQQKSYAHSLKKILCILLGCKIEDFENEEFKNSKLPEEWKVWEIEYKNYNDGITHSKLSPTKEEAIFEFNRLDNRDLIVEQPYEYLPTYREVLQHIGTDLFRNQLHPNWAINALFSEYKPNYGDPRIEAIQGFGANMTYPNWLVTDVRFQNEADAVTERGGKLIKVIRYKVGDKVWFNDKAEPDKDKNQSGEYTITKINNNEEYLISNGTTEMGAWNCEINHINKDTHASEIEQDSIPVYYTIHNCTTLEDLIENVKYIMIEEGGIEV